MNSIRASKSIENIGRRGLDVTVIFRQSSLAISVHWSVKGLMLQSKSLTCAAVDYCHGRNAPLHHVISYQSKVMSSRATRIRHLEIGEKNRR